MPKLVFVTWDSLKLNLHSWQGYSEKPQPLPQPNLCAYPSHSLIQSLINPKFFKFCSEETIFVSSNLVVSHHDAVRWTYICLYNLINASANTHFVRVEFQVGNVQ